MGPSARIGNSVARERLEGFRTPHDVLMKPPVGLRPARADAHEQKWGCRRCTDRRRELVIPSPRFPQLKAERPSVAFRAPVHVVEQYLASVGHTEVLHRTARC